MSRLLATKSKALPEEELPEFIYEITYMFIFQFWSNIKVA